MRTRNAEHGPERRETRATATNALKAEGGESDALVAARMVPASGLVHGPDAGPVRRQYEPVDPLGGSRVSPRVNGALARLRGQGQPLPADVARSMGAAMGTDLSNVRVHTGEEPAQLARSMQATAFTQGADIYFGSGSYAPRTPSGERLLAHELAHTVQRAHGSGSGSGPVIGPAADPAEAEADRVADGVLRLLRQRTVPDHADQQSDPKPGSGLPAGSLAMLRTMSADVQGAKSASGVIRRTTAASDLTAAQWGSPAAGAETGSIGPAGPAGRRVARVLRVLRSTAQSQPRHAGRPDTNTMGITRLQQTSLIGIQRPGSIPRVDPPTTPADTVQPAPLQNRYPQPAPSTNGQELTPVTARSATIRRAPTRTMPLLGPDPYGEVNLGPVQNVAGQIAQWLTIGQEVIARIKQMYLPHGSGNVDQSIQNSQGRSLTNLRAFREMHYLPDPAIAEPVKVGTQNINDLHDENAIFRNAVASAALQGGNCLQNGAIAFTLLRLRLPANTPLALVKPGNADHAFTVIGNVPVGPVNLAAAQNLVCVDAWPHVAKACILAHSFFGTWADATVRQGLANGAGYHAFDADIATQLNRLTNFRTLPYGQRGMNPRDLRAVGQNLGRADRLLHDHRNRVVPNKELEEEHAFSQLTIFNGDLAPQYQ